MDKRIRGVAPESDVARALAGGVGREMESEASITVRIERRSLRRIDPDGLGLCQKYLIDGFRVAKLIPGDDEGSINLKVSQTRVASKKEIGTMIEIEYGNT